MSNKTNPRRKGSKRTETGPRFENANPGAGCNSTHVARGRQKYKRRKTRANRRLKNRETARSARPGRLDPPGTLRIEDVGDYHVITLAGVHQEET